ncbi:MAG: hypothetical protein IT258_09345 [Saprospiraceae bacterium]|nr:hypothetical protein [Saprospiraceae bacterium]
MRQLKDNTWQIKAYISGRSDYDFFETEDGRYGIYFSEIVEYGMMKFVSPIQIWTDKQNPKKIFQSKKIKFEFQYSRSCYYLEKSDIIVLLTPCHRQNQYALLYVLLDLTKGQFALINSPNFDLKEIGKFKVQLTLNFRYSYDQVTKDKISKDNGSNINLSELNWHPIDKLDNICNLT